MLIKQGLVRLMINSLVNHLLVAMPSVQDIHFARTVIYVCEQKDEGTIGLIINRPMQHSLSMVFEQLSIAPIQVETNKLPLMYGGPIQPERGFVMHKELGGWRSSIVLQQGVTVTTSNDIIRAIAEDKGPKDMLVTLGYTGWSENQLEKELIANDWLVCPFKQEILFDVPFADRWNYAGTILGIKMNQLSTSSGHA